MQYVRTLPARDPPNTGGVFCAARDRVSTEGERGPSSPPACVLAHAHGSTGGGEGTQWYSKSTHGQLLAHLRQEYDRIVRGDSAALVRVLFIPDALQMRRARCDAPYGSGTNDIIPKRHNNDIIPKQHNNDIVPKGRTFSVSRISKTRAAESVGMSTLPPARSVFVQICLSRTLRCSIVSSRTSLPYEYACARRAPCCTSHWCMAHGATAACSASRCIARAPLVRRARLAVRASAQCTARGVHRWRRRARRLLTRSGLRLTRIG